MVWVYQEQGIMATDDETGETGQQQEEKETVNLFTVSALRLHRTRLPPTPGKEPSLVARLKKLVGGLLRRGPRG